jgi:hypothetical protein
MAWDWGFPTESNTSSDTSSDNIKTYCKECGLLLITDKLTMVITKGKCSPCANKQTKQIFECSACKKLYEDNITNIETTKNRCKRCYENNYRAPIICMCGNTKIHSHGDDVTELRSKPI